MLQTGQACTVASGCQGGRSREEEEWEELGRGGAGGGGGMVGGEKRREMAVSGVLPAFSRDGRGALLVVLLVLPLLTGWVCGASRPVTEPACGRLLRRSEASVGTVPPAVRRKARKSRSLAVEEEEAARGRLLLMLGVLQGKM